MGVLSEKAEWINGLAEIYQKQGLKISVGSTHRNEIKDKLVEVTGLDDSTVVGYLNSDYLQPEKQYLTEKAKEPKILVSQRVENELGPEVARFRKEMAPGQFHSCNEHLP